MNASGRPTRGRGVLEPLLAHLRAARANKLIPPNLRGGRILDIGCGPGAQFLCNSGFASRYGVDQLPILPEDLNVHFEQIDLNADPVLPFDDKFFSVVTMLAVVEHLSPEVVPEVFAEAHRVLQSGGRLILTTPAPWSDPLLRGMARIGLVSAEEIDEHQPALPRSELAALLRRAGFAADAIERGYFEMGLNTWVTAAR